MEEKKFRNKVGWFQFLCCAMVIWSHAGNAELFLGKAGKNHWLSRLEYVHFPAVMGVSIPCFFMISGYLFFRFFTFDQLTEKWKRRVQTLLIPYLCWNLLYYVGYLAGSRIPAVADIVNRPDLQFSLKEMLEALFFYDYNPVFWFMYQLILLVALAPVIFRCMRSVRGGVGFLFLVMAGIFFHLSFPRLGAASSLNLDALFYFCAAAWASLHRDTWGRGIEERTGGRKNMTAGAILLTAMGLLLYLGRFGGLLWERPLYTVCWRLWGVCGAVLAVKAADLPDAREWMKHNFFLYAIHFAWVRFINKAAAAAFPGSAVIALAAFILMPVLMTAVSALIGGAMRRFVPNVYYMLSGGR